MKLRKSTKKDCSLILKWRNDPVSRRNSFVTRKITTKEHMIWFRKNLNKISIIEDKVPVGIVGVDGENITTLNIAPEHRKKGYALWAMNQVKGIAYIKHTNKVSIEIVKKAGFKKFCEGYKK